MVTRRRRTLRAPADDVWAIAADPYHLPRWWPRTQRVERVSPSGWTSVLETERGRGVRADYRLEASDAPALRRWSQELEGTPFERLFHSLVTELKLGPAPGDGTTVELVIVQRPRGFARFGGLMLRRAARRQLDDALASLAALLEDAPRA